MKCGGRWWRSPKPNERMMAAVAVLSDDARASAQKGRHEQHAV